MPMPKPDELVVARIKGWTQGATDKLFGTRTNLNIEGVPNRWVEEYTRGYIQGFKETGGTCSQSL